jgi:hypothetical protein
MLVRDKVWVGRRLFLDHMLLPTCAGFKSTPLGPHECELSGPGSQDPSR